MKKLIIFSFIFILAFAFLQAWDDEKLFITVTRSGMKPNVIFIMDSSGSMMAGIYHPSFDPSSSYTGNLNNTFSTYAEEFLYISGVTDTRWHIRWIRDNTSYSSNSTTSIFEIIDTNV